MKHDKQMDSSGQLPTADLPVEAIAEIYRGETGARGELSMKELLELTDLTLKEYDAHVQKYGW